jgi:hypothetical protein
LGFWKSDFSTLRPASAFDASTFRMDTSSCRHKAFLHAGTALT